MPFKLVISDPKTRLSYQKESGEEGLVGKKIGEKIPGSIAGLDGYELEITGGSDKDGFPMRSDVSGIARKRILISGPPGLHSKARGMRKRKSIRGNTISADIVQINTKIVKHGSKPIEQVFGKKAEKKESGEKMAAEKTEEGKEEAAKEKTAEAKEHKKVSAKESKKSG